MTYGVIGAILLAILAFMVWRGHAGFTSIVIAVLLGVVIASGNGIVHRGANTAISGIQYLGNAVVSAIGSGRK